MKLSTVDPEQGVLSTEVLRRHGRSFYWAGQLLSGEQLSSAASLYSLCRGIDDLADDALTDSDKALARLTLSKLDRALAEHCPPQGDLRAVYRQAQQLLSKEPLALGALRDMIGTVQQDLQPVRVSSHRELLQYAYGVAGTVGVMMTCLLGARERNRALPHAIDLGIAMQLTNIARDVLEDAQLGRVYLPSDGAAGPLEPAALVARDTESRHQAWWGVCELLTLAESYYSSGWQGLVFLPIRARLAIAVAAQVYREIGRQILRQGEQVYWQRRSVVSRGLKLWVTVKALARLMSGSTNHRQIDHDSSLHRGLSTCLIHCQQRF
ncbi:phytoene/squalene synthase family protein [Marinobacter sp. ATCH36]|uniref:phytoene/squalene synthase family protein n=1 Tax=Marinobacter sp. ATCH36 TaxID=2945106 RepID=UPI00202021A9|nr:phytoene/squalene synthase family protein [Marinobacter sp. ATCH36]MCL7945508.1 squalene/phytoene synthase family protein [Marinobacter sp. ATCH36]